MDAPTDQPLISPELKSKLLGVLHDRHGSRLRNERFTASAERVGDNVVATIELANAERTFVYSMSAAVVRAQYAAMKASEATDIALDFLDWYLGEYFRSDRELLLPLDWQPHRFGDVEVLAKGELRNPFLDDAADAWLRGERPDVETQWRELKKSSGG